MPAKWYRTPDYDQAAKTEFSHRYNRARRPYRVQYKVIKAIHLMEAGGPGAINWAEEILTEVTLDNDAYRHDHAHAFETLAELHRRTGQWELAVHALEQWIEIASPTMSGTSGLPDLTLAEILLESDPDGLLKVAGLQLAAAHRADQVQLPAVPLPPGDRMGCRQLGQDPGPPARRALDLLDSDQPKFPRHPAVRRIHANEQTIRELRDLAQP